MKVAQVKVSGSSPPPRKLDSAALVWRTCRPPSRSDQRTLDAKWPLLRRLLLETRPAPTRLHASFYLPGDLPWAAVIGGSMGSERPRTTANDGPLINVSPGRHSESSASVHPLPTSIAAGQRGRGRNATATAVRLVDACGSPFGRSLPSGVALLISPRRPIGSPPRRGGVVRCRGSL
jgi:hypothetical protein